MQSYSLQFRRITKSSLYLKEPWTALLIRIRGLMQNGKARHITERAGIENGRCSPGSEMLKHPQQSLRELRLLRLTMCITRLKSPADFVPDLPQNRTFAQP